MKSIKIYLIPLLLLLFTSGSILAQDDFYNDKKSKEKPSLSIDNDKAINEYYTEQDYNEKHGIDKRATNSNTQVYTEDEIYSDERHRKRERNHFMDEVAAEVIVEVVLNTLFIMATFWQ